MPCLHFHPHPHPHLCLTFYLSQCLPDYAVVFREGGVAGLRRRHETRAAAVQEETSHLRWRNLLVSTTPLLPPPSVFLTIYRICILTPLTSSSNTLLNLY